MSTLIGTGDSKSRTPAVANICAVHQSARSIVCLFVSLPSRSSKCRHWCVCRETRHAYTHLNKLLAYSQHFVDTVLSALVSLIFPIIAVAPKFLQLNSGVPKGGLGVRTPPIDVANFLLVF